MLHRAGGLLGAVGDFAGDKAADALRENAKDAALRAAIQEVAPAFAQCPRCRRWVCRRVCFNAAMGLCQDCAPQVSAAAPPGTPAYAPPPGTPAYAAPPGTPFGPAVAPAVSPAPPSQPFSGAYPPPMGYAPPYGYSPAPAAPAAAHTSGLAVAAMICGMLSVVAALFAAIAFRATPLFGPLAFVFALLAVVFGHSALGAIRRGQGALGGGGMAVTGLVLGYVMLALGIVLIVFGVLTLIVLSTHLPPAVPTATP